MSNTFIFRPLVASEASRWSIISSFEARSPFVYSIRIQTRPLPTRMTRNCQKAKGLQRKTYCTGGGEGDARVGERAARCPPCSQNAHDQNVLVRCAQLRAPSATPSNTSEEGKERKGGLAIPQRAHATRGRGLPSLDARTSGNRRPPLQRKEGAW